MAHHRIVVGLDFGTTFSSLAWANTSEPQQITLMGNWPSCGSRVNHSTPSEIAYSDGNTTDFSFGYDIPPNVRRLKWFKLLLEAQDEGEQGGLQLPAGMTPTTVTRDFLSALYQHTISTLWRQHSNAVMAITKVDFVLTVPAVWSEAAKQRTRDAAAAAGFTNNHDLQLLSEPEAAAIYAIKLQDTYSIKANDRIVVCDAGGGTVDLISYAVLSIHPYLQVSECAIGTGDFCGATFIDREFERYIKARMGKYYNRLRVETQQRIIKSFEDVKCAFDDRPEKQKFFVSVPTVDTIEEAGVVNGELEISREDMRSFFDPVVNSVIALVQGQVDACSRTGQRVNAVLLVGGFGESKYLFKRLKEWAAKLNIECIQPRDAATAVVKGAVLRGVESGFGPQTIRIERKARRHYGTICNEIFIPEKHRESEAYTNTVTGKKMAKKQISWFIRKGEPLNDQRYVTKTFCRHFRKYSGPWTDNLVVCEDDNAPTRVTKAVKRLCSVTADLSDVKKSQYEHKWKNWRRYYIANYNLNLTILSGEMTFELKFKDTTKGSVVVDFQQVEPLSESK